MKKVLSVTIALCLIFASVVPAYAEAWTSQQASTVTQAVPQMLAALLQIQSAFTVDQYGHTVLDSILNSLNQLAGWLVPDGARPASAATLLDSVIVLTNYAMNHLPDISVIAGYVSSWMAQNNSYLNSINNLDSRLVNALTNNFDNSGSSTADKWKVNAHSFLGDPNVAGYPYGWYSVSTFSNTGALYEQPLPWTEGTPIGNIAVILKYLQLSNVNTALWFKSAMLTHYNDNLTTWDSQGDTLQQVAFTPESAIQGLYRYLAFTQRDVARLTYVLASDEEIETREKARETQTAVMDDFVDPDGAGAASTDDFGSISDASAGVQTNFDTGVSAGGVWNVFNRNYEWFSQETADNIAFTPNRSTRLLKSSDDQEYETPYLDSYYEELHEIIGF